MKINNITTIVDLAFNLSGSLAGIPAALSQLPAGEKIGFDTLPKLWEDVDDIGQTWTPDLDGVEVDITVEAYNPTAIQKAPYTTDMKCIDVAADYGNALLEVFESGDFVPFTNKNIEGKVSNGFVLRVFNLSGVISVDKDLPNQNLDFTAYGRTYRTRVSRLAASPTTLIMYVTSPTSSVRLLEAPSSIDGNFLVSDDTPNKWLFATQEDKERDFADYAYGTSPITFSNSDTDQLDITRTDSSWSFGRCVFIKLLR